MAYDILFTERARKDLEQLEQYVQERIIHTLERIRIRPEPYVKRLVGVPYFSLRTGNYRIILDIQKNRLIILVVTLGHRSRIYDRIK